jgi:hypothetical protein
MMTAECGVEHPEKKGVRCVALVDENHPVHYAFPDLQWGNENYSPPPRTLTKDERKEKARTVTEHVRQEKVKLRAKASSTEHAAAREIAPSTGSQREMVLKMLAHIALTDEEICTALEMNPSSQRPRRGAS